MTLNDKSSPEDQGNFWDSQRSSSKGFGWFDEGQNQARPVWNRVDLRGVLMRKSFYKFADDGAQS